MNQVVALHGFTGQGADFDPLRAFLPPGSTLSSPDLPGHGSKRLLKDLAAYSLPAHLAAISEAATASQITLLGYSMGGRLALHWAIAHPERIQRLILVGASPGLATPDEPSRRLTWIHRPRG